MLKPVEIKENLYYVGVNDRTKALFEGLWPLPKGVSYNSYLIINDKTALFDTVDLCYSDQFLQKLETALNGRKLDYLIINHMEPDHSGSISLLKTKYPEVQLVGNTRTADMINGFYNVTKDIIIVKDNDELSLGKKSLKFYMTPMVHWPETMMTYDIEDNIIFTGDAFGTFGTLDGGIIDHQTRPERFWDEMIRYYSNIVGKYGNPVQKALSKLSNVEIKMICPTHGPVWSEKENISKVIALYDQMSKYEGSNGVVIAYGSMYGHTEQMAEVIATELAVQGIKDIILHNVSKREHSYILRDIFKYNSLIIGSPTYNNELFPEIESLISKIKGRDIKNRYFSYFGSFSWAGAAVKRLTDFAEKSGFEIIGEPAEVKQALNETTYQACIQMARKMAEKLKN